MSSVTFADIADEIRNAYQPNVNEDLPYIGLEHIEQQTLRFIGIGSSKDVVSTKRKFQAGDVLFGTLRPYFRKVVLAKQGGVCSTDIAVIRPKKGISSRFVQYLIANKEFIDHSMGTSNGTRMPRAKWSIVSSYPLPSSFSQSMQENVGKILGAYDDLIENNSKRIEKLETMARLLYRHYFEVPEATDWEEKPLSACLVVHRGKSYKSSELSETKGLPFVNLKCINRGGGFRKDGLKLFTGSYKPNQQVIKGDIVMAVTDMTQERMIVARAARVPSIDGGFGVISMDIVKLEPKDDYARDYIYAFLRWSGFANEVKNHANGANVLHLLPARITDYPINVPPRGVRDAFAEKVSPIFNLIDNLQQKNEQLAQARDMLLPRLMSGEIEV